ncbi:MAG: energy transducer TonB [Thermomonas sp.]
MTKRKIGLALVLVALCMGVTAQAGNALAARKQVESSLLVQGTITIAPDGSVIAHTLDSTEALGDVLSKFVGGSLEKWHFKPVSVDGKVVTAKVPMSLRLVAKPTDDGNMNVTIASTYFGRREGLPATADVQRRARNAPPQYPKDAQRMGGMGTVYLIVQVGRNGSVLNVAAEQVNLKVLGTASEMSALRKQFTDATVRAARRWTFVPPTTSNAANEASWLVRVPVEFVLWGEQGKRAKAGQWDSYVPGPRNKDMPWAHEQLETAGSPDALSDGGVYSLEQGATLLNPPAA